MKTVAFRLQITGRVQGVSYRASTVKTAQSLGLTGWARNVEDGSVEVHVQGVSDAVEKLIGWCHTGPALARVEKVDRQPVQVDESLKTFQIVT